MSNVQYSICSVQCAMCNIQFALCNVHCAMGSVHFAMCNGLCAMHSNVHSIMCNNVQWAICDMSFVSPDVNFHCAV
jgi:hypothetical protein